MKRFVGVALRIAGGFYPFLTGRGYVTGRPIFRWAASGCAEREWIRLPNGKYLFVDPREDLGRAVYFTRDWDKKVTSVCRSLLRPGDTFLDIGGHCGLVSMSVCDLVGETGHVHVFEPQPVLAEMMERSIQRNALKNVTLHAVALSDHAGTERLSIPSGKPTLGSFSRRLEDSEYSVEVAVRHAGEYLDQLHLDQVRLIKIDVEGHERVLLEAMRDFLSRVPVDAILIESEPHEGPFAERPAPAVLRTLGFEFMALPRCLFRMRYARVGDEAKTEVYPGVHDFLAVSSALAKKGAGRW